MRNSDKNILNLLLVLCTSALFVACSSGAPDSNYTVSDPFENTNRAVFSFNSAVDDAVIHPTLRGYRAIVPKPARSGLKNFLINLRSPVRFGNQLLQGDLPGAGNEFVRTSINTLLGVGGIFDIAGYEGLEFETEDFGQTLAVWGVGHGPYLVVPFLGPSSLRDYVGYAVDSFGDPLGLYLRNIDQDGWFYGRLAADYMMLRDDLMDILEDLEFSSIDYYAATRSTYYQGRDALVRDQSGGLSSGPAIPDFDDDF